MSSEKQSLFNPERLKWYRNINLIGAVALAGAGIILPQFQGALFLGAGINSAQAATAEAIRRRKAKH